MQGRGLEVEGLGGFGCRLSKLTVNLCCFGLPAPRSSFTVLTVGSQIITV